MIGRALITAITSGLAASPRERVLPRIGRQRPLPPCSPRGRREVDGSKSRLYHTPMAHILISDDDAGILKLMATILSKAGHEVVTCSSGLETLKKLGVQPEDPSVELPDLLVLDIMMPKSDGYTVGTVIRNHPRTRGLPILVVSALREMSRLFTATVQVDGFLSKPFSPEELIADIAQILEKRKNQA